MKELDELLSHPLVIDITIYKDSKYVMQIFCNNFHILIDAETLEKGIELAYTQFKQKINQETN